MQIYERFGANSKWQTSAVFNYSQMADVCRFQLFTNGRRLPFSIIHKWQTSAVFNYSQMAELLALPAGTEEDFITEKAAEGKPVENMKGAWLKCF